MNSKAELSGIDVILYALYLLNGDRKKVHTEDIALKAYELSKYRFSWRKYYQYPDLESVRRPLLNASSNRGGNLITGRHGKTKENQESEGWIFTQEGLVWLEENKKCIEKTLLSKEDLPERTTLDKKIIDLKKTAAYRKFDKDNSLENIKEYEFTDFLDASLDTPPTVLKERVIQIKNIAHKANEKKILEFIEKAEKAFGELLW